MMPDQSDSTPSSPILADDGAVQLDANTTPLSLPMRIISSFLAKLDAIDAVSPATATALRGLLVENDGPSRDTILRVVRDATDTAAAVVNSPDLAPNSNQAAP